MSLVDLQNVLNDQFSAEGKVSVNKSVLLQAQLTPAKEDIDAFLADQLLLASSLYITSSTIQIINDELHVDGTAEALHTNANIRVTFHLSGTDIVHVTVDLRLDRTWSLKQSFSELDFKPFTDLVLSDATFILTTLETIEYNWPTMADKPIQLKQGLTLISHLTLDPLLPMLRNVLKDIPETATAILIGHLDPTLINQPSDLLQFLDLSVALPYDTNLPLKWSSPKLRIATQGTFQTTTYDFSLSLGDIPDLFPFTVAFEKLNSLEFTLHKKDVILELSSFLKALGLPDNLLSDGARLTLDDVDCKLNGINNSIVLTAHSNHYNANAVFVGLLDQIPYVFYFGMKLSGEFKLDSPPLLGKFIQQTFMTAGSLWINYASVKIRDELRNLINHQITKTPYPNLAIPEGFVVPDHFAVSLSVSVLGQQLFRFLDKRRSSSVSVPLLEDGTSQNNNCYSESEYLDPHNTFLFAEEDESQSLALDGTVLWLPSPLNVGPVSFRKMGLSFVDGSLVLQANIFISMTGLEISLMGLSIAFPIQSPSSNPVYHLDGLGVSFGSGPVKVSGTLIGSLDPVNFSGGLVIQTGNMSIYGLGAYTEVDDRPSMFVYAFLDYPIGGPVFFYVTGLTAGFGFNRSLAVPDNVNGVAEYPFVKWVEDPIEPTGNALEKVTEVLQQLADKKIVEPAIGQNWLAFGVKFNSFGFINSFALLTVRFEDKVIDLLGHSTFEFPQQNPFARAELELKASISLREGAAKIEGLISNSFLFSKSCSITGGFAFYYWFDGDHQGDFLLTIGGFHPAYKQPHYPNVERLSLNWDLVSGFRVKGSLYFAIDSNAVMGGMTLDACWKSGSIKAGFEVDTDFLMVYAPFRYYVSAGIRVYGEGKVKRIGKMGFSIRADLDVWGPRFSVKATVKNRWFKFTIQYTDDKGSDNSDRITWNEFVSEVLPGGEDKQILSVQVTDGLVKQSEEDIYIVNSENFKAVIQTVIPVKNCNVVESQVPFTLEMGNPNLQFGVGPTLTDDDKFTSEVSLIASSSDACGTQGFIATSVLKNVPNALWKYRERDKHGIPLIDDKQTTISEVTTGFTLTVKPGEAPYQLPSMRMKHLLYDISPDVQFNWSVPITAPVTAYSCDTTVWDTIEGTDASINRSFLLSALQELNYSVDSVLDIEPLTSKKTSGFMDSPAFRRPGETKMWEVCVI